VPLVAHHGLASRTRVGTVLILRRPNKSVDVLAALIHIPMMHDMPTSVNIRMEHPFQAAVIAMLDLLIRRRGRDISAISP
jgi:hypothetical protein